MRGLVVGGKDIKKLTERAIVAYFSSFALGNSSNCRTTMQMNGGKRAAAWGLLGLFGLVLLCGVVLIVVPAAVGAILGPHAVGAFAESRGFQLVSTVVLFLVPVLMWQRTAGRRSPMRIVFGEWRARAMLLSALLPVALTPAIMALSACNEMLPLPEWAENLEQAAAAAVERFLYVKEWHLLLANIVVVALVPAVCEELFFRGSVQPLLVRLTGNMHAGIWVTGLIFSLIHMQFAGALPRLVLGVLLGYLYHYGRGLWVPIVMHGVNNALGVIAYFVTARLGENPEVESAMVFDYWPLVVVSVVVSGFLVYQIARGAKDTSDASPDGFAAYTAH